MSAGPPDTGQVPGQETDAAGQIARLRAERDAALAALRQVRTTEGRRRSRRTLARRAGAVVLVVLFVILLPVTITTAWLHRTVLSTDGYLAAVAPIGTSPAVHAVVSRQVTDAAFAALEPEKVIAGALPPRAAPLAGPLSSGARSFLEESVTRFLGTAAFEQLWLSANRFAHAQLLGVLKGDTKVVSATNDQVVLNLVPMVGEALRRIQARTPALLDHKITVPEISGATIPPAACKKLGAALGRPVRPDCGQVPLVAASALTGAQRVYRAVHGLTALLLIVTPLVFAAALWASPRRRRTLLQLTIGGMAGLIVIRRLLYGVQSGLLGRAQPGNRAALEVITHEVLKGFFAVTMWFLIGGLILTALTLVTGPYPWAVAVRSGVRRAGSAAGHLASATAAQAAAAGQTAVAGHSSGDTALAWVRQHLDLLRIGGVVVAALVVLLVSMGWAGFGVTAVLLALYELGLYRLSRSWPPPSGPA